MTLRRISAVLLLLIGISLLAYNFLMVTFTMSGGVERSMVEGDRIAEWVMFAKYAALPTLGNLYIYFWSGLLAISTASYMTFRKKSP